MVNLDLGIVVQGMKDVMAKQIETKAWPWIREIKTYGGEFDDETLAFIDTFPAIWVTFKSSGAPRKISENKTVYPINLVVLVGARSVRNEEAQRLGGGRDIGTFKMLSLVHNLLIGNDLSSVNVKGLAPLELGHTRTIFNTTTRRQSVSVLSQEFNTQYTITASDRDREEAETVEDLLGVQVDYYYQPDDGIVDASDRVEFQEN
ncbi:phage protein Gp37 [Acinetobacter pittii]|uniref:phage protein Gp37 n=1 Tax=Acinetobacter pittii TaxID=48296 RepID=UPI002A0238FE|nr:phage protein Gp37 [Acinetobacter pittii]MDX8223400.1 phage protein Gp37 [Acinetobacter pittii]WPP73946.1 phage protein Gp37 [Acinetobacter pittii]